MGIFHSLVVTRPKENSVYVLVPVDDISRRLLNQSTSRKEEHLPCTTDKAFYVLEISNIVPEDFLGYQVMSQEEAQKLIMVDPNK